MPEWISIIPPIVAISFAMYKKEIIPALLLSIWLSETFLANFNPLLGFINLLERIVSVFESPDNTRILLFSLLVGMLLALYRESGSANRFVTKLSHYGFAKNRRRAALLPNIIGILIFIETNLSIITAGLVSRRLFDKFKMSRAQLAYMIDSTCSPVSVLIILNGWGAYLVSLLHQEHLPEQSLTVLLKAIPLNFYPILAILSALFMAITGKVYGSMKHSKPHDEQETETIEHAGGESKSRYMLLSLMVLISGMFFFMYYTGNGNITEGSGSRSVLWSICLSIAVCGFMLLKDNVFTLKQTIQVSIKGIGELLPLVTIVLLSFALGMSLRELGTDTFVAGLVGNHMQPIWIAPILFISAGVISFTTGTSWGTFAIMIPIGMSVAITLGVPPSFGLAAILGGAVFGDHCSPISDSTLMSSLASGCDHLEHVKTQLPYAITLAVVSILLYLVIGFFII